MNVPNFVIFGLALLIIGVIALLWLSAWRCKHEERPGCRHELQTDARWTQDGWVRVCLICREWIYCGDDYEDMP